LKKLISIDLPRRLAPGVPAPATELLLGLALPFLFFGLRSIIPDLPAEVVPFAFTFPALVLATLLAGWRSGTVALLTGQLVVWYFLLPPARSFAIGDAAHLWALGLTTFVQLMILAALGLHQREVRVGQAQRARRINFLGQALREMDHRTKNNFQIVTSMLTLQAGRSKNAEVKAALGEAVERLQALSAIYAALRPSSHGLGTVRLQDQLDEICAQIRRGILPPDIALETSLEPVLVPPDTAVAIGIIVNEIVTNACKHAFGEGGGTIIVRTAREEAHVRVEVSDDGNGFVPGTGRTGLGTRIVAAFVQRLRGTSSVRSSPEGTVHSILVPLA
jgi:two-component sensor histidine kinase